MNSIRKRIIIAFCLSAACLGGTQAWYSWSLKQSNKLETDKTPIARLVESENEVFARQISQLVWHPTESGKEFTDGDAIRTAQDAVAVIELIKGSRTIELEGGSFVVIEESPDEITLELLEGQILVGQSANTSSQALLLKHGEHKLDLSQASAQIQSEEEGLNIQTLEGEVTINSNENKTATPKRIKKGELARVVENQVQKKEGLLTALSPHPLKPHFVISGTRLKVPFKWQQKKDDLKVKVLVGAAPDQLMPVELTAPDNTIELNPGNHYWKLVAEDAQGQELESTLTYRLNIEGILRPTLISPKDKSQLALSPDQQDVIFKWTADKHFKKLILQVASDPRFLKNEKRYPATASGEQIISNLTEGRYFWRVIGYSEHPEIGTLSSPNYSFIVKQSKVELSQVSEKIKPQRIHWKESKNNEFTLGTQTHLEWNPPETQLASIDSYRMELRKVGDQSEVRYLTLAEPVFSQSIDQPGVYEIKVHALDSQQRRIASSSIKKVTITEQIPKPLEVKIEKVSAPEVVEPPKPVAPQAPRKLETESNTAERLPSQDQEEPQAPLNAPKIRMIEIE